MEEESLIKFNNPEEDNKNETKPTLHDLARQIGDLLKTETDENLTEAMKLIQEFEERMKSSK